MKLLPPLLVILLIAAGFSSVGLMLEEGFATPGPPDLGSRGPEKPPVGLAPPFAPAEGGMAPPRPHEGIPESGGNHPPRNNTGFDDALIDGWNFRMGDDSEWADTSYDDQSWDQVSLFESARFQDWLSGTGWFRKTFKVEHVEGIKSYSVNLFTQSAAVLYLDGVQILSKDEDENLGNEERQGLADIITPTKSLHLKPGKHYLAVRIERKQKIRRFDLMDPGRFRPFFLEIIPHDFAVNRSSRIKVFLAIHIFLFGLTLAIGVYHLIIWRLTKIHTRLDLYFGLFSILVGLRVLVPVLATQISWSSTFILFGVYERVIEFAMILGLVHVYREKSGVHGRAPLYLLTGIWVVVESVNRFLGIDIVLLFYLVALAELTRISILATVRQVSGWRTLYIVTMLMLSMIILTYLMSRGTLNFMVQRNLMISQMMLIPYIFIATHMARLHAFTLIRLHDELQNNEILREEAIERERLLHVREIHELHLEAQINTERLQAAQHTAAGIAHELNTPLAVANLGADMILMHLGDDPEDKDLKNYTVRIKESVEKMGGMIKQLLNISKVQTKQYVDDVSVLDLEGSSEAEARAIRSSVKIVEKRMPDNLDSSNE